MNLNNLGKFNDAQLYLGTEIIEVCQELLDELEELCMKLGTELSREEILEIVKVRFATKVNELKLKPPPKPEGDNEIR